MASMQEEVETSIIKSDRVGRARYTKEYKKQVLTAFEQTSLSAAAFADQCGIKYPTFASWVAKSRKSFSGQTSELERSHQPTFLMAEITGADNAVALIIDLPGGANLKMTHAAQLPLVVQLLKSLR